MSRVHLIAAVLLVLVGAATAGAVSPQALTAAPRCTLTGTNGADTLRGTPHRDVICGRGGDDVINGLAGNDRLVGGAGDDRLHGGAGNDSLLGGPGSDSLIGGRGTDWLRGGPGRNVCRDPSRKDLSRCVAPGRPQSWGPPVPPPPPPPQICGVATRPPDECPPRLYGVGISPSSSDLDLGPVQATVTVSADDADSPIAYVHARLRGPDGFVRTLSLTPKNKLEYEFVAPIELAATLPPGTYWIDYVSLADTAGNAVVFDETALAADRYGYREIQLYDGPDTEAPQIESLAISPPTVDTSGGPATVTMTIHATDSLSGVEHIDGGFDMPNVDGNYGFAMPRVQGGARDGYWEIEIDLPRHAAPGEWSLENLHLWDNAGNVLHFSDPMQLEALPFTQSFTQTGAGDTTPPSIVGLSIDEEIFSGRPVVYFNVHVTDDLAGVETGNCLWLEVHSVTNPGFGFVVTSPVQTSGSPLDMVLRAGTAFPDTAPTGTYVVDSIEACDLTWNLVEISGAALEAKGWDLTFQNPG